MAAPWINTPQKRLIAAEARVVQVEEELEAARRDVELKRALAKPVGHANRRTWGAKRTREAVERAESMSTPRGFQRVDHEQP